MKKIVLVAMTLLISLGMSARGVGVIGGFSSSSMNIKDFDVKAATGYHFGVGSNIPLALGFAIQPEILYNVKASIFQEMTTKTSANELANLAKLGYVEVPIQVQWGIDLALIRPYVFAEPFAGFAINGVLEESGSKTQVNFKNITERLEYGFGFGAGIELFNSIQVSAKYFWNLEKSGGLNGMINTVSTNVQEKAGFDGLIFSAAIFF